MPRSLNRIRSDSADQLGLRLLGASLAGLGKERGSPSPCRVIILAGPVLVDLPGDDGREFLQRGPVFGVFAHAVADGHEELLVHLALVLVVHEVATVRPGILSLRGARHWIGVVDWLHRVRDRHAGCVATRYHVPHYLAEPVDVGPPAVLAGDLGFGAGVALHVGEFVPEVIPFLMKLLRGQPARVPFAAYSR